MIPSLRIASALAAAVLSLAACASGPTTRAATDAARSEPSSMDRIAESYVKLVLAIGRHDADFVDAYYGPPAWKAESDSTKVPLDELRRRAESIANELAAADAGREDASRARHAYLTGQMRAVRTRLDMLGGRKLTFDEESRLLYDAVAPTYSGAHYDSVLARLEAAIPGSGPIAERYTRWRGGFVVPPAKVDSVFTASIAECRRRTAARTTLPPGESFTVEYVTGKTWSGYNWYQGNYRSLIQVNTDLPIYIDRAIDLACHEGYPGHHVYNAMLEQALVRQRGWVEFSVYALFSPQSLIAEGTANYGIRLAFPDEERASWEQRNLWPLAGLEPSKAAEYYQVQELVRELSYAGNEAARRYIDGRMTAQQAADWMVRYELRSPQSAAQRVRFVDQYRSYVINYNLGQDIVREYVERRAGNDQARRWEVFLDLLASPRLPSALR